jgi:L-fuculose-phosphate aldolase
VPLASYGLPGTPALTEPMLPLIPKYDALLLANHGAVCYGDDVWKAFFKMETVEHTARIALVAELLGGANVLPRVEVDKLIDARGRYGIKSNATGTPGCPASLEDLQRTPRGERFEVTREELIALVEEGMRAKAGV